MVDELVDNGIKEFSEYASINDMHAYETVENQDVRRFTYLKQRSDETQHLKRAGESFSDTAIMRGIEISRKRCCQSAI